MSKQQYGKNNSYLIYWMEVFALVKKDCVLELRNRTTFSSILLYICSTIFICYLSFNQHKIALNPILWNTLFWIILLFSAINTVSKSFTHDIVSRYCFYYTLASPEAVIVAKIIYNALLMIITTALSFGMYTLIMGNPVQDVPLFLVSMLLGAIGFSTTLTTIAGIAAKADRNSTLTAILGFPVILPMLLMSIKIAKNAMDGIDRSTSMNELLTILAINGIVIGTSYILFPYLWRS